MGGKAKKAFSTPGRGIANVSTLGLHELTRKTPLGKFGEKIPNKVANFATGKHFGEEGGQDAGSAPFQLDPEQIARNQAEINALGEKQYQETISAAPKIVSDQLAQVLPNIAEDYNAGHVLNSTAYPQEVARQASQLTQNLVLPAIQARQGFQTGAVQRGLNLEDFVSQANVAKSIGAQMAPQVGNGKGDSIAGLGAGAKAGSMFGPWGAAIGGAAGYVGGGGLDSPKQGQKSGK